jgi:HK97 family phage major capsid protein
MSLQSLFEEKGRLAAEIKRHADAIHAEGGNVSAERREAWDRLNADFDSLDARIKIARRAAEVSGGDYPVRREVFTHTKAALRRCSTAEAVKRLALTDDRRPIEGPIHTDEAYAEFVRRSRLARVIDRSSIGIGAVTGALGVTTDSAGGFLTPPDDLFGAIEIAQLWASPVVQVAQTFVTPNGSPFRYPMADDTADAGGGIIAEGGSRTAIDVSTSPVASELVLGALGTPKFHSGQVIVSNEELEDAMPSFLTALGTMLGDRIARVTNPFLTLGSGSSQPAGLVTGSVAGKTAASSSVFTAAEVLDLVYSIDKNYRRDSAFMCSSVVLRYLRTLADPSGRYLWVAGQGGSDDQLNGQPVVCNEAMSETFSSGEKLVIYGRLSNYKIRRVGGFRLRCFTQGYLDNDNVAFDLIARMDGALADPGNHPVKYLALA